MHLWRYLFLVGVCVNMDSKLKQFKNEIFKTSLHFLFIILTPLTVLSQVAWQQTDWSNSQYETTNNLNPNISPGELVLENETSNMVFAFSPTQYDGVWDIEIFNGKLFLAACTLPMAVNGGEIISYNYATNSFIHEYEVYEQGVIQLVAQNNKLFVPGLDSRGSWDFGNIYVYNGSSWIRKETVPKAVHVIDLLFYNDKMFVTTETYQGKISYAKVFSSINEGDSWNEEFCIFTPPNILQKHTKKNEIESNNLPELSGEVSRRFLSMGRFQNELFVQADLHEPPGKVLHKFDGDNWSNIPLEELVFSYGAFVTFQNKLYFLNKNTLFIYDGNNWISVPLPFSGGVVARSLNVYNGFLFSGAENGTLFKSSNGINWNQESVFGEPTDEIESINSFLGRLYIGTNGNQGKVFVSAAVADGFLISEKYDFGGAIDQGSISWTGLTPSQDTNIKFQIRTAETNSGLDAAEFIGPDNSGESYYSFSGETISTFHSNDRWMQYKVYLSTNNGALMPVLQDVTINVTINNLFSISGNILYHTSNQPVKNVQLSLSGYQTSSTTSDQAGAFQFADLLKGENFSVDPSKTGDISNSTILAFDAYLAAAIAIHLNPSPTEFQQIAADVDQNGTVQMYDASIILRDAVDLDPLPGTHSGEWSFDPLNRSFPNISSNISDANFTAIVLGDVDGNWSPFDDLTINASSQKSFEIIDELHNINKNKIIFPIKAEEHEKIFSFNINLNYNSAELKFLGLKKTKLSHHFETAVNDLKTGAVKIGGFATSPIINQGTYLEIEFEKKNNSNHSYKIEIESYRINNEAEKYGIVTFVNKTNETTLPNRFILQQNYPNPFNSSTIIKYQLAEDGFVCLQIYDMLGQKLKTLIESQQSAGAYQISWNGKDENNKYLSSGMYVYKIKSNEFQQAKKVIFMK